MLDQLRSGEQTSASQREWSFTFVAERLSDYLHHLKQNPTGTVENQNFTTTRVWNLPNGTQLNVQLVSLLHESAPFICAFEPDPPADLVIFQTLIDGASGAQIARIGQLF